MGWTENLLGFSKMVGVTFEGNESKASLLFEKLGGYGRT